MEKTLVKILMLVLCVTSAYGQKIENLINSKVDTSSYITGKHINGDRSKSTILSILTYSNIRQFGAIGDGVNDDTDEINNAINYGNKIYFPAGDYLVSSTIFLNKENLELYFDKGAKIIVSNGSYTYNTLFLKNTNNNTLKIIGGEFVGNNTLNALVVNAYCDNVLIEDVTIKDFANYAIQVANPDHLTGGKNNNIIVRQCNVKNTGEGIECNGSNNCVFENNTLVGGSNTYGDGLEIVRSNNFRIINNYLKDFSGPVNSSIDVGNDAINGLINSNSCVSSIVNNDVKLGITVVSNLSVNGANRQIEISNNNISGNYTTAISINGNSISIKDNIISNLNYYNATSGVNSLAINMSDDTNIVISNNILRNINGQGIVLGGKTVVVTNNFIKNCCIGTSPYEGLISANSGDDYYISNNYLSQDNIGSTRYYIEGNSATNVLIKDNIFDKTSSNFARYIENLTYKNYQNKGVETEKKGSIVIPNGSGGYNVTHNLPFTPNLNDIIIQINSVPSGFTNAVVTAVNSTYFTIALNSACTADTNVSWIISEKQ